MTGSYRNPSVDRSTASSKSGGGSSHRRDRSNSSSNNSHHHHHHHGHQRKPQSKTDLWKGSINKPIGNSIIVQMVGMDSQNHTVYARVDPNCNATALSSVPIGKVVDIMVTEGQRHIAKSILEQGIHVETSDSYPGANELLQLGAVWLLNETAYAAGDNAHATRLSPKDMNDTPDWKDMTLRVHYVPDRFFMANEVDWTKYCKGLLLDSGCTGAIIGGTKAHVPVTGLPDGKDGVIVYEDNDIGFAILNKPGGMPCYSTISNHSEDVVSMFGAAMKEREAASDGTHKAHHFLSVPLRVEPEVHGLLLTATKKEFCTYMTKQLELSYASLEASSSAAVVSSQHGSENGNTVDTTAATTDSSDAITKTYRCLVCIRDPNDIDRIEKLVGRTIEHYVDVRSPTPKHFVRNKPKSSTHEWSQCLMKITSVSSSNYNFRAACVSSKYSDSNDTTLAHRLWGPEKDHPAEHLGVQYVMQLDVQLLTKSRPHQIRGQLAALGVPIVGDVAYGGGACEMRMHHHMWTRMAVQISRFEFTLPKWEENEEKKKVLVPSDEDDEKSKCVFHLNKAWWSEYLVDYERYSLSGAMASVSVHSSQ